MDTRIIADQTVQVPVAELAPHPMNARQGNVDKIAESLEVLGQYRPIVVNRGRLTGRPNEILAGHHLVQAAADLGWQEVAVTYVEVDDDTGKRIMLADNATSDAAMNDDRLLAQLLASLPDLAGTGFSTEEMQELMVALGPTDHSDPVGPDDFPDFGDDIAIEHTCPSCGYEWSGNSSPGKRQPTHQATA